MDNLTDLDGFSSSLWQQELELDMLMLHGLALTAKAA